MTTHIIPVVDRSGSMARIWQPTIDGYNRFMQEQKTAGDALVTTVLFDDRIEYLCQATSVQFAPMMTPQNFRPRGGTALLDALGHVIEGLGPTYTRQGATRFIVPVLTDGEENQSRRYTADRIRQLVSAHEEQGWTFIFLAANIDAFAVGAQYGFDAGRTYSFQATAAGTTQAYADMSRATVAARMTL